MSSQVIFDLSGLILLKQQWITNVFHSVINKYHNIFIYALHGFYFTGI
jgi:hypothetical protein